MSHASHPVAAGLLAGCTLLSPAFAQPDNPSLGEPAVLPQVTVTAKGYAGEDLQTPMATVAVEHAEIAARGANNPGEALRGLPGLAVASDGAQGQNPVIRGLKKESVVLLVDGMRLNSAQPAGAIASFMSLGLADRIEVVKGPASVLYGTGALGGAVNVLMPQAKFTPGIGLRTAASFDSASDGVRATGVINASQGDHALMAGASLARIGDYRSPGGEVPRTGYDSDSFIGQYRFRLDGSQQLRVSLQKHEDEDVWYPGSAKYNVPNFGTTTVYSPKQDRTLAEVGYGRKGAGESPVNVDIRAYYQEVERLIYSYSTTLVRDNSRTDVTFRTKGLDAKADWLVHPQHLLSFGMSLWQMDASPDRLVANPMAGFALQRSAPFDDGRIRALGFYVQDDMRFGKLNVLAGLRHDTVKGSAASVANSRAPFGPRTTAGLENEDSAFSGSLGASYEVSPLLHPYASLSRGFRAGEMRERYESSPRGDGYYYVGNPQIKPEASTQLELGVKGQNGKLAWSAAVYRNSISDYMSGQDISGSARAGQVCPPTNANACKETVNISKVVIDGFEALAKWQAWQGHWLKAGASIVRGKNKALNEPLFQVPADELSLGWEGGIASGWSGDATLRLVKRQDRIATVFSRGTENATAGFATADLGATYRWQKQSLRIAVKNLADKAYHEHLAEGVSGREIQAPGRSLLVSWQGAF